jgi:hypothetical protein
MTLVYSLPINVLALCFADGTFKPDQSDYASPVRAALPNQYDVVLL